MQSTWLGGPHSKAKDKFRPRMWLATPFMHAWCIVHGACMRGHKGLACWHCNGRSRRCGALNASSAYFTKHNLECEEQQSNDQAGQGQPAAHRARSQSWLRTPQNLSGFTYKSS
eukprot:1159306-Pelagomonas_calceolata.AAC.16